MKSPDPKPTDDLVMSGVKFDKLMRKALQVTPQEAPSPTRKASKPKVVKKTPKSR